MSKSSVNIIYTEMLMDEGYSPAEVRFFLIANHYRKRINYIPKNMHAAREKLKELKNFVRCVAAASSGRTGQPSATGRRIRSAFVHHMDNDLRLGDALKAVRIEFPA